jgi:hypothetical protein
MEVAMKSFFSKRMDFTPLKVLLSILAISFVGMISDVSGMPPKANMFRPDLVNLKDELKMCPVLEIQITNFILGQEKAAPILRLFDKSG